MHLFKKRQKEDLQKKIYEAGYQNHMNDTSNLIEVKLHNKRVLVIGDS